MIFLWPDAGAYPDVNETSLTPTVSVGLTAARVGIKAPIQLVYAEKCWQWFALNAHLDLPSFPRTVCIHWMWLDCMVHPQRYPSNKMIATYSHKPAFKRASRSLGGRARCPSCCVANAWACVLLNGRMEISRAF